MRTTMRNRAASVKVDHHLLVDGTLKTDNSVVDSLLNFSREARVRGFQHHLQEGQGERKGQMALLIPRCPQGGKGRADWPGRAKKEGDFTMEELSRKQKSFGAIVLECTPDTSCETIYAVYSKRWEIEIVMRFYTLIAL